MARTEEQLKLIQQANDAAAIAATRAVNCATAGCLVLAREWDYIATVLKERAVWQQRALDGEFFKKWEGGTDAGQAKETGA